MLAQRDTDLQGGCSECHDGGGEGNSTKRGYQKGGNLNLSGPSLKVLSVSDRRGILCNNTRGKTATE